MAPGITNLTDSVRSVHQFKIQGYSATRENQSSNPIKFSWNVSGYEWEIRFFHETPGPIIVGREDDDPWIALDLGFHGQRQVRVNLGCRLVDPRRNLEPSEMKNVSWTSGKRREYYSDTLYLMRSDDVPSSGYVHDDSLTVECTITVLKPQKTVVVPSPPKDEPLTVPPSDLHEHLGALLESQKGGDVTFVLGSGERLLAHKNILAARSPVFMAEFFGNMGESRSRCVEIEDIEPAVFKAMLHFIYTDTVPELDGETVDAKIMAQHLLAAADRYGIERLKIICQGKLSCGIDVDTAATTLALAEQHNCSLLKAKCVDFITASPERLDAVLATEGYMHLAASCPLVLAELLKAARGRKN